MTQREQIHAEILAFRPHFDAAFKVLKYHEKFHLPLSEAEMKVAIKFAGTWYNQHRMQGEQMIVVAYANQAFNEMQARCPGILSIDLTDLEHPFRVQYEAE